MEKSNELENLVRTRPKSRILAWPVAGLTQTGMVLGTPKYMAPEQAQGETVDHRCDLFSLGSVLYRLIAGKPAFAGKNTAAALMAVVQHDPQPLENLAPDIDPDFAALIMQLLQKSPDDRPPSAAEVSNRIAGIERVARPESAKGVESDHALPFGQGVPPGTTGGTVLVPTVVYPQIEPDSVSPVRVHRTRLYLAAAAALLLLPLCYFFGGTVIRFVTNQGLLVVQVDDENVEIVIRQNGLVVKDKSTEREFQLNPVVGEIEVYIKRGNARLLTKKFTLTRGGKAYVTVTLQELKSPRAASRGIPTWQPTPKQQAFFDAVAKLKPAKQIEAVRARLKLVNPGFDGKLQVRGGVDRSAGSWWLR